MTNRLSPCIRALGFAGCLSAACFALPSLHVESYFHNIEFGKASLSDFGVSPSERQASRTLFVIEVRGDNAGNDNLAVRVLIEADYTDPRTGEDRENVILFEGRSAVFSLSQNEIKKVSSREFMVQHNPDPNVPFSYVQTIQELNDPDLEKTVAESGTIPPGEVTYTIFLEQNGSVIDSRTIRAVNRPFSELTQLTPVWPAPGETVREMVLLAGQTFRWQCFNVASSTRFIVEILKADPLRPDNPAAARELILREEFGSEARTLPQSTLKAALGEFRRHLDLHPGGYDCFWRVSALVSGGTRKVVASEYIPFSFVGVRTNAASGESLSGPGAMPSPIVTDTWTLLESVLPRRLYEQLRDKIGASCTSVTVTVNGDDVSTPASIQSITDKVRRGAIGIDNAQVH